MNAINHSPLEDPRLLIIFAYAPAGFGHLRVTDALYDGLDPHAPKPLILGSHDPMISSIHRFLSSNSLGRMLFEWSQYGWREHITQYLYMLIVRRRSNYVYQQLLTILDQRLERPSKILVVATHFTLAHQIGALKKKFVNETHIDLTLVVQVTDDSPQQIWYVPEADLTMVPSDRTRDALMSYGTQHGLPNITICQSAYPLSPTLSTVTDRDFCLDKYSQTNPDSDDTIHVVIPISGAAVGTEYIRHLSQALHTRSRRFFFHIVVKSARYTQKFISAMLTRRFVDLHVASSSREIVNIYEGVYKKDMVCFEVTKPSEQAFKALLLPTHVGGSILLFTQPVGRQEYDNIDFLRRNKLIPTHAEHTYLYERALKHLDLDTELGHKIVMNAYRWRGLVLPPNPDEAAQLITYCHSSGLFLRMMRCEDPKVESQLNREVNPYGVVSFWEHVGQLLTGR